MPFILQYKACLRRELASYKADIWLRIGHCQKHALAFIWHAKIMPNGFTGAFLLNLGGGVGEPDGILGDLKKLA